MKYSIVCFSVFFAACSGDVKEHFKSASQPQPGQNRIDCFADFDTVPANSGTGCAGDLLYKAIGDHKYLVVRIDRDRLNVSPICITYDLEGESNKVDVWVDDYGSKTYFWPVYCTDINVINQPKPERYFCEKGQITISETEGLNVMLEDLLLKDTFNQKEIIIEKEIFYHVDVSNVPG